VSNADRSERNDKKNMTFRELYMLPLSWQPLNSARHIYSQTLCNIWTTDSNVDTSNYFTPQATRYMNFTDIKLTFTDYLNLSKLSTVVNITRRSYRPWIVPKPEEDDKLISGTVSLSSNSECQVTFAPPCIWTRKFGKCFSTPSLGEEKKYQFPYRHVVFCNIRRFATPIDPEILYLIQATIIRALYN
jgi:hypothetical protein